MSNKIPSMKLFVISESTKLYRNSNRAEEDYSNHAEKLLKHANFINRNLRVGDFVPTFEHNDELFSQFQMDCLLNELLPPANLVKAYEAAKKKIIFKDWELKEETKNHITIGLINAYFILTWDKRNKEFCELRTIEDMIVFNLPTNLTFE